MGGACSKYAVIRNLCKTLVKKTKGKKPLGWPRCK